MNIDNYLRESVKNYQAYCPPEVNNKTRVHANELPWSLIDDDEFGLNYYPSDQSLMLKRKLANFYQTEVSQLALTRGSNEAIDLLIRLFAEPNQAQVMSFCPSFSLYQQLAQLNSVQSLLLPLDEGNFGLNKIEIEKNWTSRIKLIFVCNPNNPTGSIMDPESLNWLCEKAKGQAIVVIDEAYIEFSNQKSMLDNINRYENLIVLRTLSKAWGLAGLRLGVVLANQLLIEQLEKIKLPYCFATPIFALYDKLPSQEKLRQSVKKINQLKQRLYQVLANSPAIEKIYPSEANFFLVKANKTLNEHLCLFKNLSKTFNDNYYRISVPDQEGLNLVTTALEC